MDGRGFAAGCGTQRSTTEGGRSKAWRGDEGSEQMVEQMVGANVMSKMGETLTVRVAMSGSVTVAPSLLLFVYHLPHSPHLPPLTLPEAAMSRLLEAIDLHHPDRPLRVVLGMSMLTPQTHPPHTRAREKHTQRAE